jgi:hypothetical protein
MIYYPQIGTNGMMVQLPFSQSFSHLTSVSELDSGPRQSYAWRPNPLKAWDLTYAALEPIEYETLLNFFLGQQGRYAEFTFLDPGGNMVPASENFADASWEKDSTVVGASVAGPFSGSLGTTITGTTNGLLAAVVLPSGNSAGLWLCGSVYVLAPSASSLVIGFIDSGFNVLTSQSCALPANQWTRIACTTQLASNSAIRLLIGGFGSLTGPLSLFGTQVAPMGGLGAYQRTPGNYGLHSKTRFDTDLLKPQYVGPAQISLKLRLTEHA